MPWKLTWKIRTSCFLLSTCQREAQGAPYPFSPSYKGGINIMRKEKVKCFKGTVWSNHGWSECSRCRGWFCLAPFDRWYSKEGTHLLRPDQVFHHITRAVVDVLLFSKCLFCWNWSSFLTSTCSFGSYTLKHYCKTKIHHRLYSFILYKMFRKRLYKWTIYKHLHISVK